MPAVAGAGAMALGAVENPLHVARAIASGTAGQYLAEKAADKLHLSEANRKSAGDIGMLAGGGTEEIGERAQDIINGLGDTASHLAETGRNFLTSLLDEGKSMLEAKHPEGSLEAGFAKIPGYSKEPAPELPKKPEGETPNAKESKTSAGKTPEQQAEANLASARARGVRPEEYAYRSRDVGEKGVPSASLAQATTSPEEAAKIAEHRGKTTGKPQEVVKIPLHNLNPGDYVSKPGPNEI